MNYNKLLKVYEFAETAHHKQKRETGEEYITHPIIVARIASEYLADEPTIYACLLHDVVEDTQVTLNQIKEEFGEEISFLVDGVTKSDTPEKTFNKIEEYSKKDKRVIIIKLADRIHNLSTMGDSKISKKTLEKYKISTPWYIALGRSYGFNDLSNKLEEMLK